MSRLENIYYRVLIMVSGFAYNTKVAVDALSIWLVTIRNPCNLFFEDFFASFQNSAVVG